MRRYVNKASALMATGVVETAAPFARMLALSRILSLTELGFVSALSATIGAFEQVTDFAIYRSVYSAAPEEYDDALAAAHALALLRGLIVGVMATLAAPMIARAFDVNDDLQSFALLGPIILMRGFEHLAPRAAEREYRYDAQLKVSLVSNCIGLVALGFGLFFTRSHVAFLFSLYAQTVAQVAASHLVAERKYRIAFFTPHFARAIRFGYPLIFNGFGLALSNHGDRFLIGSLLGLPSLGIYAVVTLATLVPLSLISRVVAPVVIAQLYNAAGKDDGSYYARLRLSSRLLPLISAFYALGVVCLLNIVAPLVFGAKFALSPGATALLSIAIFLRQARGDPFAAMLLHSGRTKRLAVANVSSASALAFEFVLLTLFHNFEAVMAGRLLGEIVATVVTLAVTRELFKPARIDYAKAIAVGLATLVSVIGLRAAGIIGVSLVSSLATVFLAQVIFFSWGMYFVPALVKTGFPTLRQRA